MSDRDTKSLAPTLVLLHGWGCDSRSWSPVRDTLAASFPLQEMALPGFGDAPVSSLDAWLASMASRLPANCVLVGWSLGGMLAVQLAARYPKQVPGVVTLASNLSFVAREDWPCAMPRTTFDEFYQAFAQAPELTLKRFAALMAKGAPQEREQLKQLRTLGADCLAEYTSAHWQQGLDWLEAMDNREVISTLRQPGLHLLGRDDALVPVEVAPSMRACAEQQKVAVIEGSSHALHWSQPQAVCEHIIRYVNECQGGVEKSRVARSFGRAAATYDSVAALQRQIGHSLLQSLPVAGADDVWLDLGCGTGYFEPHLADALSISPAQLIALDLSEGMLQFARAARGPYRWLCADAEQLPLADASVDGVFSSLAIQWCHQLHSLFAEMARVLKPGGRIHIATLGPRTLHELRAAWSEVDQFTHVNRFASETQLREAIASSGLDVAAWRQEDIGLRYQQLRQLTHELKALGAHNMNPGQATGLTGRQRIQSFKAAYEQFRQSDGLLPATYDVFYLTLTKTH